MVLYIENSTNKVILTSLDLSKVSMKEYLTFIKQWDLHDYCQYFEALALSGRKAYTVSCRLSMSLKVKDDPDDELTPI